MKITVHMHDECIQPNRIVKVFCRWIISEIRRYTYYSSMEIDEFIVATNLVLIKFTFDNNEYVEYTVTDSNISLGGYSTDIKDYKVYKLIEELINDYEY